MKKIFLVCILLVASLFQAGPQFVQAQDVKSFVRNFYSWYIKQSLPLHGNPVFDDAIFKYVCKDTARRVRLDYERSVADADYYLKGQDVDEKLLENLIVDKSIAVNNSLSLVSEKWVHFFGPVNGKTKVDSFIGYAAHLGLIRGGTPSGLYC